MATIVVAAGAVHTGGGNTGAERVVMRGGAGGGPACGEIEGNPHSKEFSQRDLTVAL